MTIGKSKLDLALLREKLLETGGKVTEVARHFGCTHSVVSHWRRRFNMERRDRRKVTPERVRELHAKGLFDREIATELGCTPCAVRVVRTRLGIKPHGKQSERNRQRQREQLAKQKAESGVSCASVLATPEIIARKKANRLKKVGDLAERYGLPRDLLLNQVLILLALTSGAKSTATLAGVVGREMPATENPYHKLNHAPCINYLTDLCNRGLIVRIATAKSTKGSGKGVSMYSLTLETMELLSCQMKNGKD